MSGTAESNGKLELLLEAPARKGGRHAARFVYGADQHYTHKLDPDDADQRIPLLDRVARLHLGPGEGKEYEEKVADLVRGLDQEMQRQHLDARKRQEQATAAQAAQQTAAPEPEDIDAQAERLLAEMPADIRRRANDRLHRARLVEVLADDAKGIGIAGETDLVLTLYLVGISRLLHRPAAAIVKGPTSSGKSYIIDQVSSLFPDEAVIRATQMTPQSLFHMPTGSLRHRWVVAGERSRREDDDTAEATRALREMLASGRLSKLMPVKIGNELETRPIQQDGPIAYVESTSLENIFEEDENRCVCLYTDEREEQTELIVKEVASRHAGLDNGCDATRIVQTHHAMQRALRRCEVVIPFAPQLGDLLPKQRVETRRAFSHLLSIIEASALLHQFQRQEDGQGRLIATRDDYDLAARVLAGPMARLLGGGISDPAQRFWKRLREWFAGGQFTAAEAKGKEGTSRAAVYGWIGELFRSGALEQVEQGRGNRAAVWRLAVDSLDEATGAVLPGTVEVCGI
jgi:hypothetical protein